MPIDRGIAMNDRGIAMTVFERILEGIGAVEVVLVMRFLFVAACYQWSAGRREK
jgi:hypothetical protein